MTDGIQVSLRPKNLAVHRVTATQLASLAHLRATPLQVICTSAPTSHSSRYLDAAARARRPFMRAAVLS